MTATLYPGRSIHASARESVPNYPLRRALALAVAAAVLALTVLTLVGLVGVVDFGGRPAAASEIEPSASSTAGVVRIHVAEPGDTLWSIADVYRGDVGRDAFIDALIDLNDGTGIQVGQAVHLP